MPLINASKLYRCVTIHFWAITFLIFIFFFTLHTRHQVRRAQTCQGRGEKGSESREAGAELGGGAGLRAPTQAAVEPRHAAPPVPAPTAFHTDLSRRR